MALHDEAPNLEGVGVLALNRHHDLPPVVQGLGARDHARDRHACVRSPAWSTLSATGSGPVNTPWKVMKTLGFGCTSAVNAIRPRSFSEGSRDDAYPPGLLSASVVTGRPGSC